MHAIQRLARELREQGAANAFPRIHHFCCHSWDSKSGDLDWFVDYCETHQIQDENEQTIRRGLALAKALRAGESLDLAVKSAWAQFPTVTRKCGKNDCDG